VSATVSTGLDVETLELTLEPIDEIAQRELPDSVGIALDQCDEFPEELVRRMCGEEFDVQLSDVLGDDRVLSFATNHPKPGDVASPSAAAPAPATVGRDALADLFAEFLQRGRELMGGREGGLAPRAEPVVITGAALGLPGAERLFGKVRGRLEGYRTIELAGGVGADALAPIRAAMGS
jgi:hypothetical protein